MECRLCGRKIPKYTLRYILGIMDDPQFCSRECADLWIDENKDEVKRYLLDYFITRTREE